MSFFSRGWFSRIVQSTLRPKVSAKRSAVVAGRDIRDSIIKIGLDEPEIGKRIEQAQRPLAENMAALTAEIARNKGVDPAPLRVILAKLGESDVQDDAIPARLAALTDTFLELREQLGRVSSDGFKSTRSHALTLVDKGDFSGAYAVLEEARMASRLQRNSAMQSEAEFLADQARIHELQLSNIDAAEKYGQAAALVADDPRRAFQYLTKQATALQNQGEEFGDNDALRASILIWRSAKELSPFDGAPDDHRKAHNNLGSAIYSLALREPSNQNLMEVVSINREVLARDTGESAPKYWAAAQANLGSTLQVIGQRELGTERLLESLEHFREGLKVISRDQEPANWAGIQSNVGNSLKLIGQRLSNEEYFEAAVGAYREAISALNPQEVSQRAMTLMNMAAAHADLGRLRNKAEPLEQAISELQEALQLISKDRYPVLWATIKHNIGSARNSLGLITGDVSHFRDAILVNTDALTVHSREHAPLSWALCQWGIGGALKMIAAKTRDAGDALSAVHILSEANSVIAASDDEGAKPGVLGALNEAIALTKEL